MLNYTIYNKDKIAHDNCLVFIHGYTGMLETWNTLYSYFLQDNKLKNIPAIFIDNLGSGKSPQPDSEYTTQLMSEKILEILNFLKITNTVLIGHSLGGAIAQQIAITNSSIVNQLFLISSFAKADYVCKQFLSSRYELMLACISKDLIAKTSIPTIFANEYLSKTHNIELAINRVINNPQGLNGMYGQLTACIQHDTLNVINKIRCNTTIMTGDSDVLVNKKHSKLLHQLIPKSNLIYLKDCGHMVQLEKPAQLFSAIRENVIL